MSTQGPATPAVTVLLADDDLFESGYVEAVLAARGVEVVGPFSDAPDALRAVETPGLRAAVVAQSRTAGASTGLIDELGRRGIPYLTLSPATATPAGGDRPELARPFAAYQVADWVSEALGTGTQPTTD